MKKFILVLVFTLLPLLMLGHEHVYGGVLGGVVIPKPLPDPCGDDGKKCEAHNSMNN